MTSAVAPLRYPNFRLLWTASVFSATGTFIQSVAGSWLMWELTESNTWVGLMVGSVTLPLLALAIAAGALADMFDRARLMIVAQAIMGGSAAAMAILTASGSITPEMLLGLGLLLGSGVALNIPTWQALLPDLVPRGMVASAVALQSAAFNVARAVGPAIGGALVAAFGAQAGFGVNALSYLAVIGVLLLVGRKLETPERQQTSLGAAMTLGIRFARFTPTFRRLLGLVALFAITSSVVQSTLPAHTIGLGGGSFELGILLGAMGAGALVGAFVRQRVVDKLDRRTVPLTITIFGVCGIGLGLANSLLIAGIALFAAGITWVLTLANLNATAQLMAPQWIRGRAMSLYSLAFAGVLPVGAIIAGVIADAIGTSGALYVFSGAAVILGFISPAFAIPSVDAIDSPEFTADRPRAFHHEPSIEGGPVIVLNTWVIDEGDINDFVDVMNEVRLVRLSTGASSWRMFRNTTDRHRLTEVFSINTWEEHLAQHGRVDDASHELIGRARQFDRANGPRTRHLVALDMEHPHDWDDLVASHEEMHLEDGSIVEADKDV
jgi:MFS family permease